MKEKKKTQFKYEHDIILAFLKEYYNSFFEEDKINDFPVVKEPFMMHDLDIDTVYDLHRKAPDKWGDVRALIKKISLLKEIRLEKLSSKGMIEKTVAIFSLKQMGWRDKKEDTEEKQIVDNTVKVEIVEPSKIDSERVEQIQKELLNASKNN